MHVRIAQRFPADVLSDTLLRRLEVCDYERPDYDYDGEHAADRYVEDLIGSNRRAYNVLHCVTIVRRLERFLCPDNGSHSFSLGEESYVAEG